jgi:hypothetical protein
MTSFSGGCECEAVRYECIAEPMVMFNCHCRACQRVTGGPYVPVVLVPAKAFRLTKGALRYHFTASAHGERHPNKRGFCADCGSRITGGETTKRLPWVGITASSLDDPSCFHAQYDIFTSHAQPWDLMDPKLPKHEQYPPKSEKPKR